MYIFDGQSSSRMKDFALIFRKHLETQVPPDGMIMTHDLDFAIDPGSNGCTLRQEQAWSQGLVSESTDRNKVRCKNQSGKLRSTERRTRRESRIVMDIEDSVIVPSGEANSQVSAWPTTNECTQFAAVLDPIEGRVIST